MGTPEPFAGLSPERREALLEEALRHGLLAAVAGTLPADDPRLRARFERLAAGMRLRAARAGQVLSEVAEALAARGVVPAALKGPVLAERIYPEPALRPSSDLDLLVSRGQLAAAVDALLAIGFRRADPLQDAYQLRRHHHVHLAREPGPAVELHFRAASAFDAAFPTEELLARARPHRTSGGAALLVLAPEDELLTLAVHAAGHRFERLAWLLDLSLLLRRSALDWEAVDRRASAYRCQRALAYALEPLRAMGAPVPAARRSILSTGRRGLADRLSRGASRRAGRTGMVLGMAFRLVLKDRVREIPGWVIAEAGWVARRRAVRLRRWLTHRREPPPAVTAPASSPSPAGEAHRVQPAPFWLPVQGRSMLPTLREGDEVLLDSAAALALGDVVVLRHPTRSGTLLHRVIDVDEGRVVTQGDNCRRPDPPARRAQVLFRATIVRREGREGPIPPAPVRRRPWWRRIVARAAR